MAGQGSARRNFVVDQIGLAVARCAADGMQLMPPEQDLVARFGVSRTLVRESMRTLAAKGLVVIRPGIGTRILPPDSWNLFDPEVFRWRRAVGIDGGFVDRLIDFRLAVEPFAAQTASNEPNFPVSDLEHCYQRMTEGVQGIGSYVDADVSFHRTLILGGHNPFFIQLLPLLSNALNLIIELTGDIRRSEQALPLHLDIIEAIKSRDGTRAAASMREMIEISRMEAAMLKEIMVPPENR